jgi:hypothetical protein
MLNVSRNHLLAFNSLGVNYLLLISLYPLMANLLDVGNGVCVVTLTLDSQPRQGLARLQAKKEAWESCHMLPVVQESVRE